MAKKWLIISMLLFIVLVITAFLYYALVKPSTQKPIINIDKEEIAKNPELVVIEPTHLSYVLAEIGFYQLHNPPLSQNTPRINIKLNDDWYTSEFKAGKIYTKQGSAQNPDLIISTSSSEIIEAIKSGEVKEYMQASVSSGKTQIELKASYSILFSKGYLSLYKELTGKTLTGSLTKIFSQG